MARIYSIPVVQGGIGSAVECASMRDKTITCTGTFSSTNQIQGTCDGTHWQNEGTAFTGPGVINITTSWVFLRCSQSAFVSGTPTLTLTGHDER